MAYLEVSDTSNYIFRNTQEGDFIFHNTKSNSKYIFGYQSTASNPLMTVADNYVAFAGSNLNITLSNSRIGVANSNPEYPLDVQGDINLTGTLRQNGLPYVGSQFSNSSSNVFLLSSNLGINTSNPQYPLDVNGDAYIRGVTNISGHIVPTSNLAYDLGTSNMRFRDLYISGNTIDMAGTKISVDTSNNVQIKDSNNNLRKLIVDEIQIGDHTSGNAVRIKKDVTGNVQFFTATSNVETISQSASGGVSISNINQSIATASPSTGYIVNAINIPTVTMKYVQSSANISYGRVEFGSHGGFSLSNGASMTVSINHSLGTSDYMVFPTPENSVAIQVGCFNYTSSAFSMTVKNISGSNIANPVVNYQLVQAQTSNVTRVLAAPPTVSVTSCNLMAYSSASSSNKQVGLSNFTLASDPANYSIAYALASNVTGKFIFNNNTIIYNHQKTTVNSNLPIVILAANAYSSNTTTPITFNMQETVVSQPISSYSNIDTIYESTYPGETGTSNLPSTDQGLPLVYTLGTNSLGASVTGNIISWTAAGLSETRSVVLNASFETAIMAEAALSVKEITFNVTENYTNLSGIVQWVARLAGTFNDVSYGICSTSDGGIVVTGNYGSTSLTAYNANTTAFGTTLTNSGSNDVFLAKYNSSGTVQWVARLGGTGSDIGYGICSTSDGGIVVMGYYTSNPLTVYNANTTAFGTTLINSFGNTDAFLAKYNSSGTVQWVASLRGSGGGGGGDEAYGICNTNDDSVVVTGSYYANPLTAYNANTTAFGTTLTNSGSNDTFLAKYNSSGTVQWVAKLAGTVSDVGYGICSTSDGGIVVTGYYTSSPLTAYNANTTAFGTTLTNSGSQDTFLAKYNSSGAVQWVARLAGTADEYGNSICSTSDGGIVVTGFYSSNPLTVYNANTTAFGTTLTFSGSFDVFLAKYNSSGSVQWVARLGGTGDDRGNSICNTSDGGIVVTGVSSSSPLTAYNANTTAFGTTLTNSGSNDVFLAKYNSSGSVQWVARLAGTGFDSGRGICSTSDGGIVITGLYESNPLTAFDSSGNAFGQQLSNSGNYDVFIVKYSDVGPSLTPPLFRNKWVGQIGGTDTDTVRDVATSSTGDVYVVGDYTSTTTTVYDANGIGFSTTLTNSGSNDVFLAKYNSTGTVQWVARLAGTAGDNAYGISSTTDGGIVVTGQYLSTLTAYNADTTAFATTLLYVSGGDVFIVKYNSSGNVQWVARLAGTAGDNAYGISSTSDGGIVVTGNYGSNPLTAYNANTTSFGTTVSNSGNNDGFIAKYDSSGNVQWVAKISGTDTDYAACVCSTSDGSIYVSGSYAYNTQTAYNANMTAFGTTLPNSGVYDVYLAKYNSSGVVEWFARLSGTGNYDTPVGMCNTNDNGVVVVGQNHSSPLNIYNANGSFATSLTNEGSYDAYIAKYNSSGVVQWVARVSGAGIEIGYDVCSTTDGGIVMTGYFDSSPITAYHSNTTAFLTTLINTGSYDVFMVRYDSNGFVQAFVGFTSSSSDKGLSIAAHPDGDVVIGGVFYDSMTPHSSTRTLTAPAGSQDGFVAKYGVKGLSYQSASGRCEWVARLAGTGFDGGYGICSTSDGGIVVTGQYASSPLTAYNANTTAFATTLLSVSGGDVFIVKYNSSGNVQWVARLSGTGDDIGNAICSTSDGGVVVTGYYSSSSNPLTAYNANTTAFGTTLIHSGGTDIFLAKYNSSGTVQWVARLGGTGGTGGTGIDVGQGICNTSDGGIVVTGYYASSPLTAYNANTTAFETTLTNSGSNDTFLAKYNSTGTVQWVARLSGALNDFGNAICSTSDGGIVVTGFYASSPLTAYNANTTAFSTTLTNSGSGDVFLAKYNSTGSVQWVARLAGAADDRGQGICNTSDGGIVVTGYYTSSPLTAYNANTTAFSTTLTNSGSADVFLAKYNSSGTVEWVARLEGTGGDVGQGVCSTSDGGIVVTGYYSSSPLTAYNANTTAFGTTLITSGGQDTFLAKYSSEGYVQMLARLSGAGNEVGYGICFGPDRSIYLTGYYTSALTTYHANGTAFGTTLTNSGSNDVFIAKYIM